MTLAFSILMEAGLAAEGAVVRAPDEAGGMPVVLISCRAQGDS
eukprot:CAMPEP_0202918164 /NCGR_PEP_ID=MMETSP1392-20130828/72809_1 /ASSEMBLY_ACC=CAM_ASM_000868 /TAXON_ID=225041 /ORGANISM="Chlamydomonas chlamydogama, Strain SAG 11-48b" /LENGTH=42 /DNA_ID= /DNA_START= /DNA_END= /DNA_ORIENTATION=